MLNPQIMPKIMLAQSARAYTRDVGKGKRLSHDTMIQSLSNPLEREWVRGKKIVLSAGKTNIKCFQGSCTKCNFYPDHIIKKKVY